MVGCGAAFDRSQPQPSERNVEDPEFEEALARLSDPFSLNLHTAVWLGGAAAVLVTLVVLCLTGVLR